MLTLAFASGRPLPASNGREVNVWRDDRGVVCARGFVGPTHCSVDWAGVGRFAFKPGQPEVDAWPNPGIPAAQVETVFAQRLQPIILQAGSWQALHASALQTPAGVVALCGRSTSGKSTLAYALSQTGWPQVADDALLLGVAEPRVWARALPFAPRLRHDAHSHLRPSETGTGVGPLAALGAEWPLRLILLLARNAEQAEPVTLRPVPRSRAFSALLPHAHCFDPTDPLQTRRLASDYLTVAAHVPIVELHYRSGLDQLPAVLAAVVSVTNGLANGGVLSSRP